MTLQTAEAREQWRIAKIRARRFLKAWDEADHPRGEGGKWVDAGGSDEAVTVVEPPADHLPSSLPLKDTCAIHSVAFLVGKTPDQVWGDVGKDNWKEGFGADMGDIGLMLDHYGYDARIRPELTYKDDPRDPDAEQTNWRFGPLLAHISKTPELRGAKFLVYTRDHVSGVHDGEVLDVADTSGRNKVESVYQVIEKNQKRHAKSAQSDWMDECVPLLMGYGKDQIVAVAACMRMWRDAWEEAHPDGADDPGPSPKEADPESPLADTKAYNEADHPRDEGGRWTDGGGGESSGGGKPASGKKIKPTIEEFRKDKVVLSDDAKEETEKFLEAWEKTIGMDPGDFKKAFIGTDNATMVIGWRESLSGAPEESTFTIGGDVLDASGEKIASYARDIDFRKATAKSVGLTVAKTGGGVGKQILAGNVAMYQKLGIEVVETQANISVGGYAWARYGYVPKEESWFELRDELRDSMPSALVGDELIAMDKLLSSNDPRTIWVVADSVWGKELLVGRSWDGVLDLSDKDTMQRFNSYVGRK